jgi:beta-glucanase (GH16 family)
MSTGVLNVWDLYGTCTNQDNGGCWRAGNLAGGAGNIPPVMSARLRTAHKFSFKYGRVVVRAKMPVGDWLWPAIWLLPEHWVYGGWPRSGEIDMVEIIGNRYLKQNGQPIGIPKMGVAMHWGPSSDDNKFWLTNLHKTDGRNYGDNFHNYILDWSPNGIRFFIDDENQALMDVPYPLISQNRHWQNFWEWGKPWKTNANPWASGSRMAPFDQAFHFILNVAVGGTNGFIPDGAVNWDGAGHVQKPWNNGDGYINSMKKFYDARYNWLWTWNNEGENNAMQVDYIRVYQEKGL